MGVKFSVKSALTYFVKQAVGRCFGKNRLTNQKRIGTLRATVGACLFRQDFLSAGRYLKIIEYISLPFRS